MAIELGVLPIVFVTQISLSFAESFPSRDLDVLLRAVDNETNNLARLLPMLPGMSVRMTQNFAVELWMANVTDGVLASVEFPQGTRFLRTTCFGVSCLVATKLPSIAFVTVPKL